MWLFYVMATNTWQGITGVTPAISWLAAILYSANGTRLLLAPFLQGSVPPFKLHDAYA